VSSLTWLIQHKLIHICLVSYWWVWRKTYGKSHFHVSRIALPWRWMQQSLSICRYLCNTPVKTELCPLWIPHNSHINNKVKSRVPSSQEKILISASTTPFVLRVSVFDCQLGSSICFCQYESCSIRLGHVHFHLSTCPITTVLYSHRPLPKLSLFNTETLDLSDRHARCNRDTTYKNIFRRSLYTATLNLFVLNVLIFSGLGRTWFWCFLLN